jgi:excisionase family DNA binding protein
METEKVALTVDEAADATGIGRTRLYEEIASGRLIARKVGRRTVIAVEDLKLGSTIDNASRGSNRDPDV